MWCEILVHGHLDDGWSSWFDGLALTRSDGGDTVLAGDIADQAALHGVLSKVRDLGLPLIAVQCTDATLARRGSHRQAVEGAGPTGSRGDGRHARRDG